MAKHALFLAAVLFGGITGINAVAQQKTASDVAIGPAPTEAELKTSRLTDQQPTPWLVHFSGTAPSATAAVQEPVPITFSIYDDQSLGSALWSEVQLVALSPDGHYSVFLGAKTPGGLPATAFSTTEPRWLGVRVGDQPEGQRVLLVSVPYAFKAAEADRLAGHGADEFVTTQQLQQAVEKQLQQQSTPVVAGTTTAASAPKSSSGTLAVTDPATNFVDNTTDQVVSVQQNGTGIGLTANAISNVGVLGGVQAGAKPNVIAGVEGVSSLNNSYGMFAYNSARSGGVGLQARSDSSNGIGIQAWATGTSAIALNATSSAGSGNPIGLVSRVSAPNATGALITNAANGTVTGPLISATTNTGTQFMVAGNGNVSTAGSVTSASSVSGTQLISTAPNGTPPLLTASNTQVPNLNASLLGGNPSSAFAPDMGSTNYVWNSSSPEPNSNFNISGTGTIGSSLLVSTNPTVNGQATIIPDNLDTVHSWIGQAGSQLHFRLSRADNDAPKDFLITPYMYGTAIEYPGVIEVWSGAFSVHMNHRLGGNDPAFFWVGDETDTGGLFATATVSTGAGPHGNITIAADKFDHTSHGKMYFDVRNPDDAFLFNWGPYGHESVYAMIRQINSAQQIQTNIETYSGAVTGAMISDSQNNAVRFGSRSVHPVQIFTGDGWGKLFVYPSGNVTIGGAGDVSRLAVGDAAQFQVSGSGAVIIGAGTPIVSHLSITGSASFTSFDPNSCQTVSLAATGASDGDTVALGVPSALSSIDGLTWFGYISTQDTASIRACNITTSAITDVPSGTVRVDIWKH